MEVITNVINITRLSDARNTSVQVSDIALFNLEDSFENIRDAIKDENYADKIAYKDNENKPINISELLRLMYAFDVVKYPDDSVAPIQSYSGKAQVFKRYKDAYDTPFYKSLTKQLPVLVELYDLIQKKAGGETSCPLKNVRIIKKGTGIYSLNFEIPHDVEYGRIELVTVGENGKSNRLRIIDVNPTSGCETAKLNGDFIETLNMTSSGKVKIIVTLADSHDYAMEVNVYEHN